MNSLPQSSGLQNQIHLEEGLSFNNQSLNFDKEKNMINDQENDDILSIERFLAKENDEKSSFDYQSNE